MFEVGKTYMFKMDEPAEVGVLCPVLFRAKVVEIDMPLIKISRGGLQLIINVKSPAFIEAVEISN